MTPEDKLRCMVATAIVQGGWDSWTECCCHRSECSCEDPFEWHPCDGCPAQGGPCACSGVPWINDKTWARMRPWVMSVYEDLIEMERARVREPAVERNELVGQVTMDDFMDDMCPNCVTPWKCNGPHIVNSQYY